MNEQQFLLTGKVLKINSESESGLLYLPLQESVPDKVQVDEVVSPGGGAAVAERTTEKVSYSDAQIQEIDIESIVTNPNQPRKIFDQNALEELADSIKMHGIIQPIVVTRVANGYEIIVGERRYRACVLAGLKKVPAIIKGGLEDQTKLEVALIENIQRQDLNPIEEAQAYQQLMTKYNMTQVQVAKKVGKSRPAVANTIRLLNLPPSVQRAVIDGKITEGHARSLLPLQDPIRIEQMYNMVVEQGMNVRQLEHRVKELTTKKRVDSIAMPDHNVLNLENSLRGKLGAPVKISKAGRGGKITIEFFSEEELQEIVKHMLEKRASETAGQPASNPLKGVDENGYMTV